MKEIEAEKRWVLCPLCGAKTRLQLLPETELKAFPLFCPKCRHESIINARHFIIGKTARRQDAVLIAKPVMCCVLRLAVFTMPAPSA